MNPVAVVVASPQELHALIEDAVRIAMATPKQASGVREVLDEKQAAAYLDQKPGTLRQWRSISKGPAYHKKGRRVFYMKSDLDAWVASGRVFTGETPGAPYR